MNRNKLALLLVIVLGVTSITAYYLFLKPNIKKYEPINISEKAEDVAKSIEEYEEKEKKITEMTYNFGISDDKEFEILADSNYLDKPNELIDFFLSALILKDIDLFLSSFSSEAVVDDLRELKNVEEKEAYLEKVIKKMTRNYTLVEAGLVNTRQKNNDATVEIILFYKDGYEIPLTLNLTSFDDYHSTGNDYYITDSIEDILLQLKQGQNY